MYTGVFNFSCKPIGHCKGTNTKLPPLCPPQPGTSSSLPVEVALMQMVSEPPTCEYVLELIEWFEQPNKFILILERPDPCMDLFDYTEQLGGRMDEGLAREIMQQVVLAVLHCRDRGVLHRDIKVENLLLKTDTLKVKLIDFGCGDLLKDKVYKEFAGEGMGADTECCWSVTEIDISIKTLLFAVFLI